MKSISLTRTEKIGYSLLLLIYGLGIYFSNASPDYFKEVYVREDGLIEYGTSILLFCISLLLFKRLFQLGKYFPLLWKLGVLGMALLFFLGGGEEISWGQRIFGIESSEYFKQNNAQQETNLHNMVVGDTKINKLVFSQLLTLVLVIYLFFLPILYRKVKAIHRLVDGFGVPIAQMNHIVAFVLSTGMLAFMPSDKKWEIYEFAFAVIFLLIYLNPFNRDIYKLNA